MERKTAFRLQVALYLLIIILSFTSLILLENDTDIFNELTKIMVKDCWWCD